MGTDSSDSELSALVEIVRRASSIVMGHYDHDVAVDLKGPNDPVTAADREADRYICAELRRRFPDAEVVGEESSPSSRATVAALARHRTVFYVDPLDGTKEFIAHNGEFSVLIGQCVDGRPTLGVIALPAADRILAGAVGGPAYAVDRQGERWPLTLTSTARPEQVTLLVSRSHTPPLAERLRGSGRLRRVVPCGSVGVKVSRLLEGRADAYLHDGGGLKRWDCCGPEAVLRAAGGAMSDLGGALLDYRTERLTVDGGLLASNGAAHQALLASARAAAADVANGSGQGV
ncbi:MAG: 3'(2'),5'-bisphosphate nucleotidase CysQ [Deltaproteobacteria bacterium]|jgi:3'(2'), 5'-bisphosphate nucleotidase|nr:3'(2'),5'-bisphosphate nucleotidase CysQ [Deltaproteobacteria bacterium]MBW2535313.1 3'(2'),5'-bisphosphate nucleotidase CysQ [Deltaproteobacteria bacterium]